MKKVVFNESKIIEGQEYVNRAELERDYDLKKSHKIFETDPATGEKKRIPGSWKRMFYVDWMTILLVAVVVFSYVMYNGAVAECKDAMSNPCKYCSGIQFPMLTNDSLVFNYNTPLYNNDSVN